MNFVLDITYMLTESCVYLSGSFTDVEKWTFGAGDTIDNVGRRSFEVRLDVGRPLLVGEVGSRVDARTSMAKKTILGRSTRCFCGFQV